MAPRTHLRVSAKPATYFFPVLSATTSHLISSHLERELISPPREICSGHMGIIELGIYRPSIHWLAVQSKACMPSRSRFRSPSRGFINVLTSTCTQHWHGFLGEPKVQEARPYGPTTATLRVVQYAWCVLLTWIN